MQELAIISLIYEEPEWQQTKACVEATGLPVFYANRDGVGNMSRAFNEAYDKHVKGKFKYVWLVTNIIFDKDVPMKLKDGLDQFDLMGAIHPAMKGSDHIHQQPNGTMCTLKVPFIELTAPMFLCSVFERFMLCEETPYWYMDLIISYQIQSILHLIVGVDHHCEVKHVYLRNNHSDHPITVIRKRLRDYKKQSSIDYLVKTYGPNWKEILWHKTAIS